MHFRNLARSGVLTIGAAIAAVLAIAAAGCTTAAVETSTAAEQSSGHEVPQIARAWLDAWKSSDPNRLAALFTEDAVYTDRAADKVSHGQDGVATWHQGTHKLIPNVDFQLLDAFGTGDRVAIEGLYSGQIQGAPHPFALHMATVLQLRGDRIASDTDYYNLADLLRESGLPPTWTPPGG